MYDAPIIIVHDNAHILYPLFSLYAEKRILCIDQYEVIVGKCRKHDVFSRIFH